MLIFPEGTRRPAGAPSQYKIGVAYLYEATGVPVLPVAVNSGLFWPRRKFVKRPGAVSMEILQPIPPGLKRDEFMKVLRERIEGATTRLVGLQP